MHQPKLPTITPMKVKSPYLSCKKHNLNLSMTKHIRNESCYRPGTKDWSYKVTQEAGPTMSP